MHRSLPSFLAAGCFGGACVRRGAGTRTTLYVKCEEARRPRLTDVGPWSILMPRNPKRASVVVMKPVEPVLTVDLFPKLSRELMVLLRGLARQDWERPTACASWSVKDVAAHLLGGNIGRLSFGRDGFAHSDSACVSHDQLVKFIDRENAEWVEAAGRISPRLLIELLDQTDRQLYRYLKALSPHAAAAIPVSWAGEDRSPNWFDIAREYMEKWLHQQHIREAVGQPLLTQRRWLFPVLDTAMRALPYTYRAVEVEDGAVLVFCITGEAGGVWSLLRREGAWRLFSGSDAEALCRVSLGQEVAWRLFSKGMSRAAARPHIQIDGDQALGSEILNMVSIMA